MPFPPTVISGRFRWDQGLFFNVMFQNAGNPDLSWEGRARVDTGMAQTWLSEYVIRELDLDRLRNKALLPDPTGGTSIVNYGSIHLACISIALNNSEGEDWVLEKWPVLPLPETADVNAIVGRDILKQGDLGLSSGGDYTFTVRRPLAYEVELSGGVEER